MNGDSIYSANSQSLKRFQRHQKVRFLLILVIIGIPLAIGAAAYRYYQQAINPNQAKVQPAQQSVGTGQAPEAISVDTANPTVSDSLAAPNSPASSIPPQVEAGLASIEANGLKGNPYVASNIDTSQIPTGTKFTFDRASWLTLNSNSGTINANVSVLSTNRAGSVTFAIVGDSWKVTGYSIASS